MPEFNCFICACFLRKNISFTTFATLSAREVWVCEGVRVRECVFWLFSKKCIHKLCIWMQMDRAN